MRIEGLPPQSLRCKRTRILHLELVDGCTLEIHIEKVGGLIQVKTQVSHLDTSESTAINASTTTLYSRYIPIWAVSSVIFFGAASGLLS
jgi:hypothetical protein